MVKTSNKRAKTDRQELDKNKGVAVIKDSDLFIPYWQLKKKNFTGHYQIALTLSRCATTPADRTATKRKKPIDIVGKTGHLLAQVILNTSFIFFSLFFSNVF